MKTFLTIVIVLFISAQIDAQKVFSVDYQSQADVKVFVVKYSSQADKKIYFVEYESQADLKIFFVKYQSQACWKKNYKKQLMY